MNTLLPVVKIMQRCGVRCSAEEFHSAVNLTFHQFESEVYDDIHRDMWDSLPAQVALLAADCLRSHPGLPEKLSALDIGCGTGLAGDSLLKSELGQRICAIDLIDTSPEMLRRAAARAARWNVPTAFHEGTVDTLAGGKPYDLIVTCSVLHHVPDVAGFLRTVRRLQPAGGLFLHLQDPNADFYNDAEFLRRVQQASERRPPEWLARLTPRRILGRIARQMKGEQGNDYLSKTKRELLRSGIVATPLTAAEIFTITDIHVQDNQGISIAQIKRWLPEYGLISQRSYAFFGQLGSTLPTRLRAKEEELIAQRALNGGHVAAAWRLVGNA